MTLEEAQNRIIELTEELSNLRTERDTLSQDNESLRTERDNLRELNQKYFNKIIAQDTTPANQNDEDTDEDPPTCEEFAATLNI